MSDADTQRPGSAVRWAGLTFAFVGLCIACYLAWLSLTGRAAPGCGSGAGCGEVLGSRWSAVGPVPVSVFAAGAYLSVIALLVFPRGRVAWREVLLGGVGLALIGAAAWYIYLQAGVIGAWCPYCLAGHGVGVVLGLILFGATLIGGGTHMRWLPAAIIGIVCMCLFIGLQVAVPAAAKSIALPSDSDFDITDGTGRHLGLLGGKLQFDADDTPHHGPTDGAEVIVLLVDYGCPHCRTAHEMLSEALAQRGGLVVFALPVSLHEDDNPHIPLEHERFENSYELALLSLAVWRDAPDRWAEYDRWLFEGNETLEGDLRWPRTLDAAERYAGELIGEAKAAQAYTDAELLAQVNANINTIKVVLDLTPGVQRGLPIVMAPYAGGAIYGRFDEPRLLDAILEDARSGRE